MASGQAFAIKAAIADLPAKHYVFPAHKTMYGGKRIAAGDRAFLFASENDGGRGLFACGVVITSEPILPTPGLARQTPRVSVAVEVTDLAKIVLGRSELRVFRDWADGGPQTELNFKLYRQATNKIVGLTESAAVFLSAMF